MWSEDAGFDSAHEAGTLKAGTNPDADDLDTRNEHGMYGFGIALA